MNPIIKALSEDPNIAAEFRAALPVGHTPGEWVTDGAFVYALNEGGSNRFFAGIQPGWQRGMRRTEDDARTSQDEVEANARLIAAAPALLAALQAISDQEQHDGQPETHMHDMADIARAAIARATS